MIKRIKHYYKTETDNIRNLWGMAFYFEAICALIVLSILTYMGSVLLAAIAVYIWGWLL